MPLTKRYEPLPGRASDSMGEFLRYTIFGLAFAGVYFIAASGLVVTYTASGIFNFAHGAVAMIAAFTLLGAAGAAPLAGTAGVRCGVVFVLAPIIGVVIERVIMRNLGGAATITNIVVTIGLLVTLLGHRLGGVGAEQVRGDAVASAVLPGQRRHASRVRRSRGTTSSCSPSRRSSRSACGCCSRGTRLGIAMRAVVDDRNLARLNGENPDVASAAELGRRLHARRAGRQSCSRRSSRSTSPASRCWSSTRTRSRWSAACAACRSPRSAR